MRCHYEILEISKNATEEEIKKSYRRLALQWHPDKNVDRVEECTKYFPLIQQAYEVLSDPDERAWYDRHREAILKGGLDEHYKDNSLNLFAYFSSSCYSGYGDDEKGYYTVYGHVFDILAQEDADFMTDKTVDSIPRFGDSQSQYEAVVAPFYAYWQSYCTQKPYSWLDEHDILRAPNRRILRIMEKENKKIRDAAKKIRNDEVRALVAFVRKRDKRVVTYRKLLEEQRKEQLAKVESQRINQKLKNIQAASDYTDATWHDIDAREDDLKEIESHFDACDDYAPTYSGITNSDVIPDSRDLDDNITLDENHCSDDNSYDDHCDLYCVACEKAFKTDKSFQNHERSKKHKENVNLLKTHMTEEDFKLLGLDADRKVLKTSPPESDLVARPANAKQCPVQSTANVDGDTGTGGASTENNIPSDLVEKLVINDHSASKPVKTKINVLPNHHAHDQKKETQCSTCYERFETRNNLFSHLKESGHAALKLPPKSQAKSARKKK